MKRPVLLKAAWIGPMLSMAALAAVHAQPPAGPAFEVASVKPNKTGDQRVMLSLPPTGRLTATNIPLRLLLRQAFDVQDFQRHRSRRTTHRGLRFTCSDIVRTAA